MMTTQNAIIIRAKMCETSLDHVTINVNVLQQYKSALRLPPSQFTSKRLYKLKFHPI